MIGHFDPGAALAQDSDCFFLDGVYVERPDGPLRFGWEKPPTGGELVQMTQTLARRTGRYRERQGLLERYAEKSYLAGDSLEAGPLDQLPGSSITYRIAVGPQQGRKVFTLQTLPACDDPFAAGAGKVAGFRYTQASRHVQTNARTRAAVWMCQSAGDRGKTPVAHPEWQRPTRTEDATRRRHGERIARAGAGRVQTTDSK